MIKKYAAIQVDTKTVDDEVNISLKLGDITGPYYNRDYPEFTHDTEQQAMDWAKKESTYADWLIVPVINFRDERD